MQQISYFQSDKQNLSLAEADRLLSLRHILIHIMEFYSHFSNSDLLNKMRQYCEKNELVQCKGDN